MSNRSQELNSVSTDLPGYEEALSQCAFFLRERAGYLRVSGPHRTEFLQRMTTNDMAAASVGHALLNVLPTPTANIIDVFTVFADEANVGLLPLPYRAVSTAQFLRSMIFFMDEVSISDESERFIQFDVCGPGSADLLIHLGVREQVKGSEVHHVEFLGFECVVIGRAATLGLGCCIVAPSEARKTLVDALGEGGAVELPAETYRILCIERGIPGHDVELTDQYNPLEVGLDNAISSTKGCYTGQEIIARQINYDKRARTMVGLRFDQSVPVHTEIRSNGRLAGEVTSVGYSPSHRWIGLGILRRSQLEDGMTLTAETEEGQVAVEVAALPFR